MSELNISFTPFSAIADTREKKFFRSIYEVSKSNVKKIYQGKNPSGKNPNQISKKNIQVYLFLTLFTQLNQLSLLIFAFVTFLPCL